MRGKDARKPISISFEEVKRLGYKIAILDDLYSYGEITREPIQGKNEKIYYLYGANNAGAVDPNLLTNTRTAPLDEITASMREMLKTVSLKPNSESTPYFDVFLMWKDYNISLFYTVDQYSGRVHTPISNFHRPYRKNILLNGKGTISIDVVTMQPLLLGSVLKSKIGENEYSNWIDSGEDIYIKLQNKANLSTRDKAKKRFFEILFSYSNNSLSKLFGNSAWIEWVNEFKSKPYTPNPRTLEKNHSNLAWLLQRTEVFIMREVWSKLLEHGILFVSVHDEVIVPLEQYDEATTIFKSVMDKYFDYYRLSDKQITAKKQANNRQITTEKQSNNSHKTVIAPPPPKEVAIPKPKRGELYSINELKTKFQLSDEVIKQNFDEFYHNIGWINI
jgi:hypothetical protein